MKVSGTGLGWLAMGLLAMGTGGVAAQTAATKMGTMPGIQDGMMAAAGQAASPAEKDDLFAGTEKFSKGASKVTEVNLDPDSLDMVTGTQGKRAHNMVLNVVRVYKYDKPGMYNMEDVEQYRRKLETGDWHCSVHVRDLTKGESTDVCSKHRTDGMSEQAILSVKPEQLTFIHTISRSEKGGGDSLLMLPDVDGAIAVLGPEMAAMGPVLQAKLAVLTPEMEARMAAMGPEMEARMAGMQAQIKAATEAAQKQLKANGMDKGK